MYFVESFIEQIWTEAVLLLANLKHRGAGLFFLNTRGKSELYIITQ